MKSVVAFLLMTLAVAQSQELKAVVKLSPNSSDRNVTGVVTFVQSVPNGPVKITGTIYGLNANQKHGFHVHEKGDIVTKNCLSTKGHFNPNKVNHGAPNDTVRHVGDLGNVESDANGIAQVDITDLEISLSGPNNVIGRAIVVHSGEDDLGRTDHPDSKVTGNAGGRWACGVIGIM